MLYEARTHFEWCVGHFPLQPTHIASVGSYMGLAMGVQFLLGRDAYQDGHSTVCAQIMPVIVSEHGPCLCP